MSELNRQVVLASRPKGTPRVENFALRSVKLPRLQRGDVHLQNLVLSLDAGFRNWMNEHSGNHVLPTMTLGEPVIGLTLGRVVESHHDSFAPGDVLVSRQAWEEHSVVRGDDIIVKLRIDPGDAHPLTWHVGVLGDTGMSAYFGMLDIGRPRPGETVLVSAAGGAVGSVAGQIGRLQDARVVGIASGATKCNRLVAELGYHAAVDRTAADFEEQLASSAPAGIDVYFDNAGGPLLEKVLARINLHARIVLCGAVADYESASATGPSNLFQLVVKQARMEGFMTNALGSRYAEARTQLSSWLAAGQLKNVEDVRVGLEETPQAFCDLLGGRTFGKTAIRLG